MSMSVNAEKLLKVVVGLVAEHGPYTALQDVRNAFLGKPFDFVNKVTIDKLLSEGVTSNDVYEIQDVHHAHCKILQQYMIEEMENDLKIKEMEKEVGSLVEKAKGKLKKVLSNEKVSEFTGTAAAIKSAGISILDTSFVFTESRLQAVQDLINANITPKQAFSIVDQSKGDMISAMQSNLAEANAMLYNFVSTIAEEQHVDPYTIKATLIHDFQLNQSTSYNFKIDYERIIEKLKEHVQNTIVGLHLDVFVSVTMTEDFFARLKADALTIKLRNANGLILEDVIANLDIDEKHHAKFLEYASIDDIVNLKTHQLSDNYCAQIASNHSSWGYVAPAAECMSPPLVPVSDPLAIGTAYKEGMMTGAAGGAIATAAAILAATYLARPLYNNLVKPIAHSVYRSCSTVNTFFTQPKLKNDADIANDIEATKPLKSQP